MICFFGLRNCKRVQQSATAHLFCLDSCRSVQSKWLKISLQETRLPTTETGPSTRTRYFSHTIIRTTTVQTEIYLQFCSIAVIVKVLSSLSQSERHHSSLWLRVVFLIKLIFWRLVLWPFAHLHKSKIVA